MKRILALVTLGFFLFTSSGIAQPRKSFYHVIDFSKGLNTHISKWNLSANQSSETLNVRFNKQYSAVAKRPTFIQYGTVGSSAVTSLHRYYKADATKYLLATGSTYIYRGDDDTGKTGTFTTIGQGYTDGALWTWVTYQDNAIGMNGNQRPIKYDGKTDVTADTTEHRLAGYVVTDLGAPFAEMKTGETLTGEKYFSYLIVFYDGITYTYSTARSNPIFTGPDDASDVRDIRLTDIPLGPAGTTNRYIFRTIAHSTASAAYGDDASDFLMVKDLGNNSVVVWNDDVAVGSEPDSPNWAMVIVSGTDVTIPIGKYGVIHGEKLWIAGNSTYPSELYWSEAYTPDYFGVLDVEKIRPDDGDSITFLREQLGALIVAKENTVQKFYTDSASPANWYTSVPFSFIGCPAPYTVANSPLGIIYLGRKGLYRFNGQNSQLISDAVTPEIDDIRDTEFGNSIGFYWKNEYHLSYVSDSSGESITNRDLIYDIIRDAYTIDNVNIGAFCAFDSGTDYGILYSGSSDTDGVVYAHEGSPSGLVLRYKSAFDAGTYDDTMSYGTEDNPYISLEALDKMEDYNNDVLAQAAWVTSETTEKIPPDLGDGSDGDRVIGGEGSIAGFIDVEDEVHVKVTSASHSLLNNDEVVITASTNYDGTYVATNVDTDTFEIVATYVEDTEEETGMWTGGDVTFTENAYDFLSLTVNSSKTLNLLAGNDTTIKVRGDLVNAGIISGSTALTLRAITVTNSGDIINNQIHIRANTITNTGTITDDPIQSSTMTIEDSTLTHRHEPGDPHTPESGIIGTVASTYDEDYDTYYGASITSGVRDHSMSIMVEWDFGFVTDITNVKKQAYGVWISGDGNDTAYTSLYYDNQWNIIYYEAPGRGSHMGTSAVEIEGLWTEVSKAKINVSSSHYSTTGGTAAVKLHEIEMIGTDPRYDYINATGVSDDDNDTSDFENPLQCYSESATVNEGDYALKIRCGNGSTTLDEYLAKSITSIDLSNSTHDTILIDVKASRSGTNFQLGIDEFGGDFSGTAKLQDVAVAVADTWETVSIDFSGVTDSAKNAIRLLRLKFTDTDVFNELYIDNIRPSLTSGNWVSPVYTVNASKFDKLYWNETLGTYGNVTLEMKASDTSGTMGEYNDAVTAPLGSDISGITGTDYVQFRVNFTTTNGQYPPLIDQANNYIIKMTYAKIGVTDEDSFLSKVVGGWEDFEVEGYKKQLKRIKTYYSGTTGNLVVNYKNAEGDVNSDIVIDMTIIPPYTDEATGNKYTGNENEKIFTFYVPSNYEGLAATGQWWMFTISETGTEEWVVERIECMYEVINIYD